MRFVVCLTAPAVLALLVGVAPVAADEPCHSGHGTGCGNGYGENPYSPNTTFTPGWAYPDYFYAVRYPCICPYPMPLASPYHPLPYTAPMMPVIPIPGPKPGPKPDPNVQPPKVQPPKTPASNPQPVPPAVDPAGDPSPVLLMAYRSW